MSNEIINLLLSNRDLKYQKFQSSLIPNIDASEIIGVRAPIVRRIAKNIFEKEFQNNFLNSLPHTYHEENLLHAYLVSMVKDFDECVERIDSFLPFVNNWAICDSIRPKCFKNNTEKLLPYIKKWISSPHTYTSRFGIEMLMVHYLGDGFKEEYHNFVISANSDDYYHKMMKAWYFATALSKQYQNTCGYITREILGEWIFNKTIQKATESRVITEEHKKYLKSLK